MIEEASERRVLITGAAGAIGSLLRDRLVSRWRIRATDVRAAEGTPANHAAWLGRDDCVALFLAAVEAELGGFTIVHGVSANRHRLAELGEEAERIGYRPVQDAWADTG